MFECLRDRFLARPSSGLAETGRDDFDQLQLAGEVYDVDGNQTWVAFSSPEGRNRIWVDLSDSQEIQNSNTVTQASADCTIVSEELSRIVDTAPDISDREFWAPLLGHFARRSRQMVIESTEDL